MSVAKLTALLDTDLLTLMKQQANGSRKRWRSEEIARDAYEKFGLPYEEFRPICKLALSLAWS